jgi:hypothetical protein
MIITGGEALTGDHLARIHGAIGTLPRPSSNTCGARLASGMTTVSIGP